MTPSSRALLRTSLTSSRTAGLIAALILVGATTGVASGCAGLKTTSSTAASSDALPVIDAHVHTKFTGEREPFTGVLMSEAEFDRQGREIGLVGAIAMGDRDEKFVSNLKHKNIIHCAGLKAIPDYSKLERDLKSKRYRCIKVYLGYVHQFASHAAYQPAYRLARKYKVPVVFHTGDIYTSKGKLKYSDPLTIDEVAVDYPDVKFVIAHLGNPWIQSAAEVAYKNPNVWVEASALLIGDLSDAPREKLDEYVTKPIAWAFGYLEDPKKLLYGTDWPLTVMKPYFEAFKRGIPKEHWRAVFHDNAAHVFGFPLDPARESR